MQRDFDFYIEEARKINLQKKDNIINNDTSEEVVINESTTDVKITAGLFIKKAPNAIKQFKIESVNDGKIKVEGVKKEYNEEEFFKKYDKSTLSEKEDSNGS